MKTFIILVLLALVVFIVWLPSKRIYEDEDADIYKWQKRTDKLNKKKKKCRGI